MAYLWLPFFPSSIISRLFFSFPFLPLIADGAAPDMITGGAGWVGAGLLGLVLCWLLLVRLPANDKTIKDLIEDRDLLSWMISQLKPVKAQVVARRYWLEGLATATIAHQMALSRDRIEQIRAKAKHDLEALAQTMKRMWKE